MSNKQKWEEATYKSVIRPQRARIHCNFDEWVTKDSPKWQRECFVQLRRYQSLECHDGMSMDASDTCWRFTEILSLTDDCLNEKREKYEESLIGAICFTRKPEIIMLEFCWIHPFWRNKGLVKSKWPLFQKKFGIFHVSYPRTKAMQGLLKSVGFIDPNLQ
ncbi:hypothetical protein [Nitrosomonas sp.]|uniref:hypothetical protein n=1 Tax=Nitrosomonas sp. TaxID=42353 RepID=UPI0025ED533E|nr:hypothetical protein [Nitrosomonas sp.]